MTAASHRLRISLDSLQAQLLRELAEREGVSRSEVVRRLIESAAAPIERSPESLWEIAGLADDPGELVEGVPVSERPDLYLARRH